MDNGYTMSEMKRALWLAKDIGYLLLTYKHYLFIHCLSIQDYTTDPNNKTYIKHYVLYGE